jgi:hypothetical protein
MWTPWRIRRRNAISISVLLRHSCTMLLATHLRIPSALAKFLCVRSGSAGVGLAVDGWFLGAGGVEPRQGFCLFSRPRRVYAVCAACRSAFGG